MGVWFLEPLQRNSLVELFILVLDHHSTETAIIKVPLDLLRASDSGLVSIVALLDLGAAFDTADHGIPLQIPGEVTGIALVPIRFST